MKSIIITATMLCLILGASSHVFAQTVKKPDRAKTGKRHKKQQNGKTEHQIKYITIDYLNDADLSYTYREDFENSIGIRLININKKLVDVNKEITSTSFNTTPPDAFKIFAGTTIPTANSAEPATVAALANPLTGILFDEADILKVRDSLRGKVQACQQMYKAISDKIIALGSKSTAYLVNYKYLKNFLNYENELLSLGKQCRLTFPEVQQKLSEITKGRLIADQTDLDDVLDAQALTTAAEGDFVKSRMIIENYLKQVVSNNEKLFPDVSLAFGDGNLALIKQDIAVFTKLSADLSTSLKRLKNRTEGETNIFLVVSDIRLPNTLDNYLAVTTDFFKILDVSTLNKNVVNFEATGITELLGYYDAFNESNYTYYIAPQELNNDLTTFSINVSPKDNAPCVVEPKTYKIKIRAKTGLKIDFSTGLFANLGGNNFLDQSYRFEPMPGDTTVQVLRNKNKNFMYPTLGALMHIYKRNGTDFQPSLCFGVSTKDLSKINFHFGGSMIMGYAQRFILNAGVTLGKTTLIEDKYTEEQIIRKDAAPNAVPTADFNRVGFFFSFTYNLAAK